MVTRHYPKGEPVEAAEDIRPGAFVALDSDGRAIDAIAHMGAGPYRSRVDPFGRSRRLWSWWRRVLIRWRRRWLVWRGRPRWVRCARCGTARRPWHVTPYRYPTRFLRGPTCREWCGPPKPNIPPPSAPYGTKRYPEPPQWIAWPGYKEKRIV